MRKSPPPTLTLYQVHKTNKYRFSSFFNHIDHFSQEEFLYVTSGGIAAAKPSLQNAPGDAQAETGKTGRISQREALAAVEPASDNESGGEEGG